MQTIPLTSVGVFLRNWARRLILAAARRDQAGGQCCRDVRASGKIQLHPAKIAFESAEARNDLVKLPIVFLLLGADRAQHVQYQIGPFVAHGVAPALP